MNSREWQRKNRERAREHNRRSRERQKNPNFHRCFGCGRLRICQQVERLEAHTMKPIMRWFCEECL